MANEINDQHSLGKGEVVSSILTSSTMKRLQYQRFRRGQLSPIRQFDTERSAKRAALNVENLRTLFARRSLSLTADKTTPHLPPYEYKTPWC